MQRILDIGRILQDSQRWVQIIMASKVSLGLCFVPPFSCHCYLIISGPRIQPIKGISQTEVRGLFLQFLWVWSSGKSWLGSVLRVSPAYNPSVSWAAFSSENSTGKDSTSKLIQVIGRMHFLRILTSGWLSASGCPQILEATHSSLPCRLI